MIRKYLVLLLLLFVGSLSRAQENIPVILRISAGAQNDSIGSAIIREMGNALRQPLLEGKLCLWDSERRKIRIQPASIIAIEEASGYQMDAAPVVFFYESWTKSDKQWQAQLRGILFGGHTADQGDVVFGFVDADSAARYFQSSTITANINGNYRATVQAELSRRNYNYQFLQFGRQLLRGADDSAILADSLGLPATLYVSQSADLPQKQVEYQLAVSDTFTGPDSVARVVNIHNSLENFFKANLEVFYNLGGEKVSGNVYPSPWKVTAVQVTELWKRINGTIFRQFMSCSIYVNNVLLAELSPSELDQLEWRPGGQTAGSWIRSGQAEFRIVRVNSTSISADKAAACLEGLETFYWNRLSEFIRYY